MVYRKRIKDEKVKKQKQNKHYFFISCTSNIGLSLHLNRFRVLPLDHNTDFTQMAIARCSLALRVDSRTVRRTFLIQLHNFLLIGSIILNFVSYLE